MLEKIALLLSLLATYGSVAMPIYCPVRSPVGQLVYFADRPSTVRVGLSLTQCTIQCAHCQSFDNCDSSCRCFNYNSVTTNCSLFYFEPNTTRVVDDSQTAAYQVGRRINIVSYFASRHKRRNVSIRISLNSENSAVRIPNCEDAHSNVENRNKIALWRALPVVSTLIRHSCVGYRGHLCAKNL
jgi:hypothetical protein